MVPSLPAVKTRTLVLLMVLACSVLLKRTWMYPRLSATDEVTTTGVTAIICRFSSGSSEQRFACGLVVTFFLLGRRRQNQLMPTRQPPIKEIWDKDRPLISAR